MLIRFFIILIAIFAVNTATFGVYHGQNVQNGQDDAPLQADSAENYPESEEASNETSDADDGELSHLEALIQLRAHRLSFENSNTVQSHHIFELLRPPQA